MDWNKPLPQPTPLSAPFWDGLKAHAVCLQRCDQGHWIFFPRSHCPSCGSRNLAWHKVSGEGTLYTYTVARVPTLPEFTDEMPQILAVVQLDEGPHLNTTLVGVDESALRVGLRVRAVFDGRPGSMTLLRYTAIDSRQPSVIAAAPATAPEVVATSISSGVAVPPAVPVEPPRRQVSCKDFDAMASLVSSEFSGWSNELVVTQELIDQFAALSGDDYWIHTDPIKAREQGPFGTTIAHGMLVQALVSRLKLPLDFEITGFSNMVNYGSDRMRFPTPVPVGCRIRSRARIKAVQPVKSGVQVTMEINVYVVGQDRPSAINDLIVLYR